MNAPLTAEEAKNLTFPCLLEVWCFDNRAGHYALISHTTEKGRFITLTDAIWHKAALPSPEITEAMRKQFAIKSEYPKRMLVWDGAETNSAERIVLADLGEKCESRYPAVSRCDEKSFEMGETYHIVSWHNAKPLPEPDPISQEIAQLRQRLMELEAKHNQQL